jgi:hypothetical protein
MNHVYLTDDEIKQLALPVLVEHGIGTDIGLDRLNVVSPVFDEETGIWSLEVMHPASAALDARSSISAGSEVAQVILRAGDPRFFVVRHRFDVTSRDAA